MVRCELLLPLYSHDGRTIEPEKFLHTDEELVGQCGATSTDSVVVSGRLTITSARNDNELA